MVTSEVEEEADALTTAEVEEEADALTIAATSKGTCGFVTACEYHECVL